MAPKSCPECNGPIFGHRKCPLCGAHTNALLGLFVNWIRLTGFYALGVLPTILGHFLKIPVLFWIGAILCLWMFLTEVALKRASFLTSWHLVAAVAVKLSGGDWVTSSGLGLAIGTVLGLAQTTLLHTIPSMLSLLLIKQPRSH